MKASEIFMFAIIIAGILGSAEAASLDITKSDFVISAKTKDSKSLMLSVSAEWLSNISSTSQNSRSMRAMVEMAVIDEVRKYNFIELESSKPVIESNIMSNVVEKARSVDISVNDIKIIEIIDKSKSSDNNPKIIEVSYIPLWMYALVVVAFIIGYYLGYDNKKRNNELIGKK